MMELRYSPITDEWIMLSSDRQNRPVQPSQSVCPLCPGGVEFDRDYDLAVFDNRFPSLRLDAPEIDPTDDPVFTNLPAAGKCEVVMYTSDHGSSLSRMPVGQVEKLVCVWEDRTREISKNENIRYVFPFENRGKEVGATLAHPHGQLYAFSFLPKRVQAMADAVKKYEKEHGRCPMCDVVEAEIKHGERVIYEGDRFVAVVPYFARFPYEVHIYSKRHLSFFTQMSAREKFDLAVALKVVTSKYDHLFEEEFPYMMAIFQAPVNGASEDMHFHIEFYPPKRDKSRVKWMASVETGTWAFINPSTPSKVAEELRKAPYII